MTRITINDVARVSGVSKGAVSFALNGRAGVADDTRARILGVARELGWTPSARARALSVSRALAVGLIIARRPETLGADPFFTSFIAGVELALSERDYALLLQVVPDHGRERENYRRLSREGRVDGVLVTDLYVDDPRPGLLRDLGLPAVMIGPALPDDGWPAVGVDDGPGIAAATRHLVDLGHRRIGYVGGPEAMVHGRSRHHAWRRALEEAGLPPGPQVAGDFTAGSGARATERLLDRANRPTAIVYANDLMATAGLAVAAAQGLRVPDDLSVTGFDDTETGAHLVPALTSVSTDVVAWGRAAAARLLALLHDEPAPSVDLAPPRLVVRHSTTTAPERHGRTSS